MKKKRLKKKPCKFTQGYACAAAIIAKLDTPSEARELISEGGFTKEDLIKADVEQCDIDTIYGKGRE